MFQCRGLNFFGADGACRSISSDDWKPLGKFHLHMLDENSVEKPSKEAASALITKLRKGENFEPNALQQIAVAAANMTPKPTVSSQRQHNILSTYSQQKYAVAGRQSYNIKAAESKLRMAKFNRKDQDSCVSEDAVSSDSHDDQVGAKYTCVEMRANCETSLPALEFWKDSPISDKVEWESPRGGLCCLEMAQIDMSPSKNLIGDMTKSEKEQTATRVASEMEMATSTKEKSVVSIAHCTTPVQDYNPNIRPKRYKPSKEFSNDVRKCPETYASQYQKMCRLKGLDRNSFDTCNAAVECTGSIVQERRQEHESEMDRMTVESEMSSPTQECVQQERESLVNETAIEFGGDEVPSSCTPTWLSTQEEDSRDIFDMQQTRECVPECVEQESDTWVNETAMEFGGDEAPSTSTPTGTFTIEEKMVSDIFDMKELEQTRHQLEKIADTAKALHLGLKDHDPHLEKVHLTKAQVANRNEAQDWLSNMAMERARSKISEICDGGRVRQLVQTFESIK